jgi:flagellar biosynthetic protein FliP
MTSTLKIMLLLTVLSLAPSILIMTTCFIRFVIVLGLLRQALGTQQLPPNQVIVSLCLFLTLMVMAPVWQQAYEQGIRPYTSAQPGEQQPTLEEAFQNTVQPLRQFMSEQIHKSDNGDAVWLFLEFRNPEGAEAAPQNYDDVPLTVLLPAYMLSELKTAFVIGFQIYLPFLVIDMVVSSVLISMGMMMLPPVLISLPFKLLLFVLIDGWFLTVGMLLESVRPFG